MKPNNTATFSVQPTQQLKGASLWTRLNRELGAATTPRRPGVQGRWKTTDRVSLNV
jgi:hypothetical protein